MRYKISKSQQDEDEQEEKEEISRKGIPFYEENTSTHSNNGRGLWCDRSICCVILYELLLYSTVAIHLVHGENIFKLPR